MKLKKHIKRLTAAALSGMVAISLFTPVAMAEDDAVLSESEISQTVSEETDTKAGTETETASYNVRLAAWADQDYSQEGNLYHVGKSFYVDVVVSGDSFSGFQGEVIYDSSKLIYDDTQTQEYVSKENGKSTALLTIAKGSDGVVNVLRTGNVASSKNTIIARIYFTARKDNQTEITMSNVKVGLDSSDGVLSEDQITSCTVDITKVYMMVDPALGAGQLHVNGIDDYDVDVDGTFAVDVLSIGTTIEGAQVTVTYDSSKLTLDTGKADEAMTETQGLTIDYQTAGQVTIIRNSDGLVSGKSIARLWFKATASGIATVDIASAKAGTVGNQTTYDAADLAGCKVTVNEPVVDGVEVTLTDYIGSSAEYTGIAAGSNTLKGEFTFTVKSASTPAAAYTTDGGQTYTKLTATKIADAENTYSFTAAAAEGMQIAVALLGDVNLDGTVNAKDSQSVLRYASDMELLSGLQLHIANTDGTLDEQNAPLVNSKDAQLILQYASGMITEFPTI